jgi:hypothetical protein
VKCEFDVCDVCDVCGVTSLEGIYIRKETCGGIYNSLMVIRTEGLDN